MNRTCLKVSASAPTQLVKSRRSIAPDWYKVGKIYKASPLKSIGMLPCMRTRRAHTSACGMLHPISHTRPIVICGIRGDEVSPPFLQMLADTLTVTSQRRFGKMTFAGIPNVAQLATAAMLPTGTTASQQTSQLLHTVPKSKKLSKRPPDKRRMAWPAPMNSDDYYH